MEEAYKQLFKKYLTHNDYEFGKKCKDVKQQLDEGSDNKTDFSYKELIPYPEKEDLGFNEIIFHKKEFNFQNIDQKLPSCTLDAFELSTSQKFLKNFISPFTPFNGVLLFHSVGVGKTCSAISIAERYYEVYKRKILVILGQNIRENFKKQIFDIEKYNIMSDESNQCTGTMYTDLIPNKIRLSPNDLEKKVQRIISERYEFIGYIELANHVNKIKRAIKKKDNKKFDEHFSEAIHMEFSNRLIIVDEAHNLRATSDVSSSKALEKILTFSNNIKLVFMTATPMYDSPSEIILLINFLLLNDKRPTLKRSNIFDKEDDLTEEGAIILKENIRGYVSYMRGENPYTFPKKLYPSINQDTGLIKKFPSIDIQGIRISKSKRLENLEIIGTQFSPEQQSLYDREEDEKPDNAEDELEEEENASESHVDKEGMQFMKLRYKVQISNIAYPNKTYGKTGFVKYFKQIGDKLEYTQSDYGQFLSYDLIGIYAPKIKRIIDYVINSEGIVFIYSQFYPSGIYPLVLALEHIGFTKYGSNENFGKNLNVQNKLGGKKYSYAVISTKPSLSPDNKGHIAKLKSAKNMNGDIIKVVIVSVIATEGIDFKNIREVHVLEPWYNLSRIEQIVGRSVRRCSHLDMEHEKRNVTVYLHASTYENHKKETIDLQMYRISWNKFKVIQKIETILKSSAIDCAINYRYLSFNKDDINITLDRMTTSQKTDIHNYRLGDDTNNAFTCDYMPSKVIDKLDETTFHKVFILDDILLYKKYIALHISQNNIINFTYQQVKDSLILQYQVVDEDILKYALDEMVLHRYMFILIKKQRAYLIYRANQYIVQYDKLKDERMPIMSRKDLTSRQKGIDLKSFVNQPIKKKKKSRNIVGDIEKSVEELSNRLDPYFGGKQLLILNYIDYVIDRLSEIDYLTLLRHLIVSDETQLEAFAIQIKEALRANGMFMTSNGDDSSIEFIYNHFKKTLQYLNVESNEFVDISTVQRAIKGEQLCDSFMRKKQFKISDRGFIGVHGTSKERKFKVFGNGKRSGQVCLTVKSDELIRILKETGEDSELDLEAIENGKITNGTKCDVIEVLLRANRLFSLTQPDKTQL